MALRCRNITTRAEFAVIGGGLVGMAVAYGLQKCGRQVVVFDEEDRAYRASRGNFGLVWVQGKGIEMPDYARWTRLSASLWPQFAEELRQITGINIELKQPGGFDICLNEQEAEKQIQRLESLRSALDGDYPFEFLGHNALREQIPEIGPEVVGAIYGPEDGHVNPLYLLRALTQAFQHKGGRLINGHRVDKITPLNNGFQIENNNTPALQADQVVLCAGLGNAGLAPMVGLNAPLEPVRGQVLICERVKPFLRYPSAQIRQVGEGAVQIGDSKENVGFNDATTPEVIAKIAQRAVRIYPLLKQVRVVRSWAALRIMSPDGHPIYDQSSIFPGASMVTCHSGVTLAAAHANVIPAWITATKNSHQPDYMKTFSANRFAMPATH